MVGKVLSLHPKESVQKAVSEIVGHPISQRTLNGMRIPVNAGMKWEKIPENSSWFSPSRTKKGLFY